MIDGVVDPSWEAVRTAFRDNIEQGLDDGASLAVSVDGTPVVDLWGGVDPLSGRAFERDSVTVGFSVSKGVTAIALLQLVDRGLVDLDAPVARYWPEFAAAGKQHVTVRELAAHRAALPALGLDPIDQVLDWDTAVSALASQPQQYDGSRFFTYHALSFGFLVGEVVRRVSGLGFTEYVQRHIAGPLGLDLWIGQPASVEPRFRPSITRDIDADGIPVVPVEGADVCIAAARSTVELLPVFRAVDGVQGTEPFNQLPFRQAALPAGNAVTNGRALARLYAACLGEVNGVRLVSPELLAEAARDQADGIRKPDCASDDPWRDGRQQVWGLGFEISNGDNPMLGQGSVGHTGMGGRQGFAHLPSGISLGYVSQRMAYPQPGTPDPRMARILDAVQEAAGL